MYATQVGASAHAGGRKRRRVDLLGRQPELLEKALVQRPLHQNRDFRVAVEGHQPVIVGGFGGGKAQTLGIITQVVRVLHHIELERLA